MQIVIIHSIQMETDYVRIFYSFRVWDDITAQRMVLHNLFTRYDQCTIMNLKIPV